MATKVVEGQLPYTGGTAINIDGNKVISVLLREENNLILVNDDNELYTDLQLVDGIKPSDDFPVGVTVGKILASDGWTRNGLLLNRKTTSGDYARWIYGANGEIYFDGGNGTRKQVYYSDEVDALFTQLRGELATVAFTGDYNDLINRPAFLQEQADWEQADTDAPDYIKNKPTIPTVNDATLTVQKNGIGLGSFTANSNTNTTINIPVPNVINNVTSTSTTDSLSAAQGKILQDQITDLQALGRFLSLWDCSTGQPDSFPLQTPYNYSTGDYYLVSTVDATTNYRPNGVQYTGTASTTVETDEVEVGDIYLFDGTVWLLQINHGKTVSFANLAGQPSDNAALATALNSKANVADLNTKTFYINGTSDLTNAQAAYDWLQDGKNPIIDFSGTIYTYWRSTAGGNSIGFRSSRINSIVSQGNDISNITIDYVTIIASNGTVTSIIASEDLPAANYLDTSVNYQTPYTPAYDGSPATKKYVDDSVSDKITKNVNDLTYYTPTSSLATVATTGSYSDLTNTPTIPSVNNPTITFTQGGVSKGDITLNQSSNETIALDAGGDMDYSDFAWDTATGATVTLELNTEITPSANFTVNAPSTIKDGQTYILRVTNGATAYTMTLGTNITNPYSTDTTLTANGVDQFVFLAIGGNLELQPDAEGGSGITKIFTLSSTSDLTNAQAALDRYNNGGNPIIKSGNTSYHLHAVGTGAATFSSAVGYGSTSSGTWGMLSTMSFTLSSGTVTAISGNTNYIQLSSSAPGSGTTNSQITIVI